MRLDTAETQAINFEQNTRQTKAQGAVTSTTSSSHHLSKILAGRDYYPNTLHIY